jgi:galactokinase
MPDFKDFHDALTQDKYAPRLTFFYADDAPRQKERLLALADLFSARFGSEGDVTLFSSPGRSEIGGNHTDHNLGKVLAASVNLDIIALARKNNAGVIFVRSVGHGTQNMDTGNLTPLPSDKGTSLALIRGVCAGFVQRGFSVGGFDAATASDVLRGAGISSSAAFEVLIGTILNHFYNGDRVEPLVIAQIAQEAENKFFGKPCGLLDQTACATGGFVGVDFADPAAPRVRRIDYDFAASGHALVLVNTGGSHADLTQDYAAVRGEMCAVAAFFGETSLRACSHAALLENLSAVRTQCGDRAVLRALHFFAENDRVDAEIAALEAGDFDEFKALVIESGASSYMYNQNVHTGRDAGNQPVSLALALSQEYLTGEGAWRVHGGGFAGTVQAFVPLNLLETYTAAMCAVFGRESCYVLRVRPQGGCILL